MLGDPLTPTTPGVKVTKKDYIAIADAINATMWSPGADPATLTVLISRLHIVFEKDNPRFDSKRFWQACTADPSTK